MRKLVMSAMVASAIMVSATAKPVFADTDVYLNFGPPAVRYEAVPAPRADYAPTWQQSNGRYYLQRERWVEGSRVARGPGNDRDRDGIPNQYDRDRDNDGVSNNRDSQPDNPRRR